MGVVREDFFALASVSGLLLRRRRGSVAPLLLGGVVREDFFALASVSGLLLRSLVVDNQGQTALTGDILTVSIQ
jgi:hypothetical protein